MELQGVFMDWLIFMMSRGIGGGGAGVELRHLIICFHYCYGLDILFVLTGLQPVNMSTTM